MKHGLLGELNKKKRKKKMEQQQKRWLTGGGCCLSQASNMSLIEADAWQTHMYNIAQALTEAADRG